LVLDRKIIAIFCTAFLGIIIIRASVYRNSTLELVDSFSADVESAQLHVRHISGRDSMRLVVYEYSLVLNSTKCHRLEIDKEMYDIFKGKTGLEIDKEMYDIFKGKTGSVSIEKYYRTEVGSIEYEIVSWIVNKSQ